MEWSAQQEQALKKINDWYKSGDPLFKLFGYAGTGKTTLAKQIAQDVGGRVLFSAYTGKAAYVLKQKGCRGASTIHSLIYHTADKSQQRLFELKSELASLIKEVHEKQDGKVGVNKDVLKLKRAIEKEEHELSKPFFRLNLDSDLQFANLLIIDECSMVGKQMGEDLLSFKTPILVLGDPAQLPPVGDGGFFTLGKPHHMLTEIHRQAKDNPIIRIATDIRQGRGIEYGDYGNSRIVKKTDITPDMALEANQILVGRNKTRRIINNRMRELLGFKDIYPGVTDKLVCLRNNHDLNLLNGSLWVVDASNHDGGEYVELMIKPEEDFNNGEQVEVLAHAKPFLGQDLKMPWWDRKLADEFDYGYALTCHKSQGSQWEKVFIFDESAAFQANKNNWLYTAVTRASEEVIVVKGY